MPATGVGRGLDLQTEKAAMRVVIEEEEQAGRRVQRLNKRGEGVEGCDFLSHPPDGGPPDPVEVKGWSAPFRSVKRGETVWSYGSEVNFEQLERARTDPLWRLEIVANLRAVRERTGEAQRLSLTATEVVERAQTVEVPNSARRPRSADQVAHLLLRGGSPTMGVPGHHASRSSLSQSHASRSDSSETRAWSTRS